MSSQFTFEAIGTHWVVDIFEPLSKEGEVKVLEQIRERIDVFDKAYSRFRSDSLVTEMSQKAGEYTLPDDAEKMMSLYHDVFLLTDGLVTPLIGQVLVDSGYDAQYSLKQKKELEVPLSWDEVLEYYHPHLQMKQPALLDFGGAGKGYLVDLVGEVLEQNGIRSYCVDAGGDMLHRSKAGEAMSVGLEHPGDTTKAIGVVKICNQSLCASAGNRRVWQNFHHIINPKTLSSPGHIAALWVIAESTILADILATALFFVSTQKLLQKYSFEYLILNADYSFEKSTGFPAEMFVV